jgi:carboxyl-terminal processing protease
MIFRDKQEGGETMRRVSSAVIVLCLMTASFLAGTYAGPVGNNADNNQAAGAMVDRITGKGERPPRDLGGEVDFKLFWQVWDMLKDSYVKKDTLTEKQLFYGALSGMVAAAGDPYTVFMDPELSDEFESGLTGSFDGIGAEISIKDEIVTVVAPLPGTPAEKAGLLPGDKIYAINGTSTMGMSVDQAVSLIRGPKGTEVKLTIFRDGADGAKEVSVIRDTIVIKSVNLSYVDDGKIALVKISSFDDNTKELFDQAVLDIIKKNPKGVILDLRNNPGGYLETAIDVSSEWVEDGAVVSERFSNGETRSYEARGSARLKGYETVILINEGSASASEIVAGALRDYGKASLVGQKSFGKGSVQTLEELEDGSSVKITIAEWLTPKGNNINSEGVKPDHEVELNQEDFDANKDPQLDKAVQIIKD